MRLQHPREVSLIDLDDVEKTVRDALNEAKKYEHMIMSDEPASKPATNKQPQHAADQGLKNDANTD